MRQACVQRGAAGAVATTARSQSCLVTRRRAEAAGQACSTAAPRAAVPTGARRPQAAYPVSWQQAVGAGYLAAAVDEVKLLAAIGACGCSMFGGGPCWCDWHACVGIKAWGQTCSAWIHGGRGHAPKCARVDASCVALFLGDLINACRRTEVGWPRRVRRLPPHRREARIRRCCADGWRQ